MGNETCIRNTLNLPSGPYHSGAKPQILNATALENIQTGHKTSRGGDPDLQGKETPDLQHKLSPSETRV